MNNRQNAVTRRIFIQALGAGGLSALLGACEQTEPAGTTSIEMQAGAPDLGGAHTTR